MIVRDLMSPAVVSVSPADTVGTACATLRDKHIHHLIVVDNGRVVGLLTLRELLYKPETTRVSDVMLRDVVSVDVSEPVRSAAKLMLGRPAGCLPVMNGSTLAGIITTTDLLRAASAS